MTIEPGKVNMTSSRQQSKATPSSKRGRSGQPSVESSSAKEKTAKPRHRASVACAACRDRRIRCVVPPGDKECTPCKRSGVECVIKNDDERRRPISRAYVYSLVERVALLEDMLRDRGEEPPPAIHPPKVRHGSPENEDLMAASKRKATPSLQHDHISPRQLLRPQDEHITTHAHYAHQNESLYGNANKADSPSMLPPPKENGMVKRLLSTRGHLSFDELSGRLRYFGPTTNWHVHSDSINSVDSAHEQSLQQTQRANDIISSLPVETYQYLMELFWQHYNTVLHVLHEEAFNEDRDMGQTQFYSGFLHICVLAMGFRFADKKRPDMQKISFSQLESTLHREAKYMLEDELERSGGIPLIAALLILSDLETGVGRDTLGWLYGGMAIRLAFDIGLHLDTRVAGLSAREVDIRQMTLWACVIYDKYWALFLGRPTSMKASDLEINQLSRQFERLGTCRPAGVGKSMETMIYEALIDLMELAGKITENMDTRSNNLGSAIDCTQHKRMAALHREFSTWYDRLPENLQWTPNNIATAPSSFFLLHQQYHSCIILLHRPFALYEDDSGNTGQSIKSEGHYSTLSRTICTRHAIRVARIYWQLRQRFPTEPVFLTAMQHVGTAATALVAALASIKDVNERNNNMQYLECLSTALSELAQLYQPAERMSVVLRAVMVELRGGHAASQPKLDKPIVAAIPTRGGSMSEHSGYDKTSQTGQERQIGLPNPGTAMKAMTSGVSATPSARVMNHNVNGNMNMNMNVNVSSAHTPHFDDTTRMDGYSAISTSSWQVSNPSLELSHGLSAPGNIPAYSHPVHTGLWATSGFDGNNSLAAVHFPDVGSFQRQSGGADGSGVVDLGEAGDWDMNSEWAGDMDVWTDSYGFPLHGGSNAPGH